MKLMLQRDQMKLGCCVDSEEPSPDHSHTQCKLTSTRGPRPFEFQATVRTTLSFNRLIATAGSLLVYQHSWVPRRGMGPL